MKIAIRKVNKLATLPVYQTKEAAGADLYACLEKPIKISAGEVRIVPTGVSIALPKGFEGQVRSRSGLAAKQSIAVLNSPGTVDSDYRGEIKVILINHGTDNFTVNHNDRIAQLVIARHESVVFEESAKLDLSERGESGFGSTGK